MASFDVAYSLSIGWVAWSTGNKTPIINLGTYMEVSRQLRASAALSQVSITDENLKEKNILTINSSLFSP